MNLFPLFVINIKAVFSFRAASLFVLGNSCLTGQQWGRCEPPITCPLCGRAVYSAGTPLSPVEGQKNEVTKYFISQVKHTSPISLKRRRDTHTQRETDHSDKCAISLIDSFLVVSGIHRRK